MRAELNLKVLFGCKNVSFMGAGKLTRTASLKSTNEKVQGLMEFQLFFIFRIDESFHDSQSIFCEFRSVGGFCCGQAFLFN